MLNHTLHRAVTMSFKGRIVSKLAIPVDVQGKEGN